MKTITKIKRKEEAFKETFSVLDGFQEDDDDLAKYMDTFGPVKAGNNNGK